MNSNTPAYVIFGCGYVGARLAQSLRADDVPVRVCARRIALLEPLRSLGAELHYLDASRPHQFGPALLGLDQPVVVYAIPPVSHLPQGEAVRRAASAALKVHARAFIYLSSSAVYGRSEGNSNDEWVDESAAVASGDPEASTRLAEEAAIQAAAQGGLPSLLLRLSAIYGPALLPAQPARGVRQRLRSGQYKLWDGGRYYFSRIHVDDLTRIIRRAAERLSSGGLPSSFYVVGDDHPCPQGEYAAWLCEHLKLPLPQAVDSRLASGPGHAIRGRRLRNTRIKRELDLELLYPTFREGEAQIDAVEQSGTLPPLGLTGKPKAEVAADSGKPQPERTAAVLPSVPAGLDLGVAVGGQPVGVSLLTLPASQSAETGKVYLVLSGKLKASRGSETPIEVGPRALVPAHFTLRNTDSVPAELLAITVHR